MSRSSLIRMDGRRLGRSRRDTAFRCFFVFLGLAVSGFAQGSPAAGVRFEQRIGEKIPLDVTLTDTTGASRRLGEYFHGQPVVLFFGYARCPQLCSVVADGTVEVLRHLERTVGRDLQVVTVSLDPEEKTNDAKATEALAVRRYGRTGTAAGWHYLTGTERAVRTVTDAAGFHFRYDPVSREYAHASGFLVITPEGTISKYFFGIDFDATDVAAALNRAAAGKTGRSIYELLLLCFRGDAIGGRYGVIIWRTLAVAVALTIATLFGGIGWMLYQEHRGSSAGKERS